MDTTDLDDAEKILTEYINSDSTSNSNILDETEAELLKFLAPSPARKKPRKKRFITYQYDCNGNRVYKEKNQSQTRRKKKKKEQAIEEETNGIELGLEIGAEIEITASGESTNKEFDNELEACTEALQDFLRTPSNNTRKKTWTQRMADTEEQWFDIREDLLSISIKRFCPIRCFRCSDSPPVVRCGACGYLCGDCDEDVHQHEPLHDRIAFIEGKVIPLSPCQVIEEGNLLTKTVRLIKLEYVKCCNCFQIQNVTTLTRIPQDETVVVIGLRGRFLLHKWSFSCQNCTFHQRALNLESGLWSGYWPTSPKTLNTVIEEDLLMFWDSFRKRMPGSSAKAFVDTLNDISITNGRDGSIYPQLLAHAFKEWCFLQHELDGKKGFNWMQCPSCEISQHSCHVDGNCKLYRFKSGGNRRRESYYKNFIVADDLVKDYLKVVYPSKKKHDVNDSDYVCGGKWTAAKNVGRKKGKLDETGLEVGTCRHRFAQTALNMKQGELYGYPLYIMKHHMLPRKVEFAWSDVMCKLWGFAKRIEPSIAEDLNPALSVMHAKGHSLECQMKWDGQWLEDTGRTTGEETEQFFSYIGRCSNTTKYQLPEGREETITELTMHWNWRKTISLPFQLTSQYIKNVRNLAVNKDDFEKICAQNNFVYSKTDVMALKDDLEASLPKSQKGTIEHKIEGLFFEKTYWKSVLKKVGDRSKRRSYIRRKITKVKDAMTKALREKAMIHAMEDCFNGKFPWKSIDEMSSNGISATEKRLIVDAFMRWRRCEEEKTILKKDMENFLKFNRNRVKVIRNEISSRNELNLADPLQIAEVNLLSMGLNFFEKQLFMGVEYFSKFEELEVFEPPQRHFSPDGESKYENTNESEDESEDDHCILYSTTDDESDVEEQLFVETSLGNIGLL